MRKTEDPQLKHMTTDAALLAYIVVAIISNSSKGNFTPLKEIMASNAIKDLEFTEDEIIKAFHRTEGILFYHQYPNGEMQTILNDLRDDKKIRK